MTAAIQIQNVSKRYRLGEVGTGTLSHDLNRLWAKIRMRPDPYAKIGMENDRTKAGGDYVWALRDISFEVEEGEVLGIIGRNGAGKSTLLKLLSRVTAPTMGKIRAKGRIASLLEVGTGFHPELTGRENIYLNGAILGMKRREISGRLDEIVEFSGCAKYLDTPVKRYSSGMMVRLGFAVAAHLECEILIVDEVLAVGDVDFQTRCIGKMKDVSSKGRTVLFVSHNLTTIRSLCRSALILEKGKASSICDAKDAISSYLRSSALERVPLSERRDRYGSGEVRFEEAFIPGQGEKAMIESGEALEIAMTLKGKESSKKDLELAIAIFTIEGLRITNVDSKSHETELAISAGYSEFYVKIQLPYLAPGDYYLNLHASISGNLSDYLEKVVHFSVIMPDSMKEKKFRSLRQGEFFVEDVSFVNSK